MPIEIQPAPNAASAPAARRALSEIKIGPSGVSGRDRIFFTERLALLLETGNPLHASLHALARQAGGDAMREVIGELEDDVSGGLSFSQALGRHPEAFPPAYVSIVAAGEQGGFLPQVLDRLRELDEKRHELRATLFSAFSYPAFLTVFSAAVVLFVLMVVFPKFGDLFQLIWDKLPVTTRVLMTVSELLRSYWPAFLAALAGLGLGAWQTLRDPGRRAALEGLLVRLPVIGEIVVLFQLVQFMYVMSLAMGNGVAALDALRSCREVVSSASFRDFVRALEANVQQGRGLAVGFQDASFVPDLVRQMVATGEESGSLPLVMGRMAAFYEREWKQRLATLAKLIEPAMLVVMGVVVGLIVSSLILPIFKLSTTVG
jgi:type II secretory pathway component PulF